VNDLSAALEEGGTMTDQLPPIRQGRHHVADAHGRTINLTPHGPAPQAHGCPCQHQAPPAQGRAASAAVTVAALLAAGAVLSVLLLVIRDVIITTLASTSLAGLALNALLSSSDRKEQ
jgi:hypothetical protein